MVTKQDRMIGKRYIRSLGSGIDIYTLLYIDSLEKTLMLGGIGAGEEGDNRG